MSFMVMASEWPAGCSKRPDFSPAQPWRAETRLVPGKAATPRWPSFYVSRLTFHGSRERSENAAGGRFQHPARCTRLWL